LSAFAGSSALVKLYADEAGHEQVRSLVSIAVAQLARVEVPAALWRKQRMGELSAGDARLLTADFEADYFGPTLSPRVSPPS
jgi:predicted nucleic acid-binding protein